MNEIIARKVIENGEEIIELDLNKPWPKRQARTYLNYKDEIEKGILNENKRKKTKEFIEVIN